MFFVAIIAYLLCGRASRLKPKQHWAFTILIPLHQIICAFRLQNPHLSLSEMEPSCEIDHSSFVQSLTQKLQDCGRNPIEICQEEASGLVRHLKLSARELARLDKSYKQPHFHCTYGDYISQLCKDLKEESSKRFKVLQPSASDLLDKIVEKARICEDIEDPRATPVLDALEKRASELVTESVKVELELAKFAINAYVSRNKACHSKGLTAYWTGDNEFTGNAVDDDIAEIRNCFTENEVDLAGKWRSLLLYWREQNLVQYIFGSWKEAPKATNKGKLETENIPRRLANRSPGVQRAIESYKDCSSGASKAIPGSF